MAKGSFFKDFKAFITRGNVIDMAVGVVIGGAFGKIVTGLVNYIINPFVGLFMSSGSFDSVKTVIHEAVMEGETVVTPEVAILWGTWFQTIIDFLITAFCIFIILRIIMTTKQALQKEEIEKAAAAAAEEKAKAEAAEKAAAEAAAALAAKQAELEASTLRQELLLSEIKDLLKNKYR